jgi:hypothetical protein
MRVDIGVSFLVLLLASGAAQASAAHVSSHARTKSCFTEKFSVDDVRTQTAQSTHRRAKSNSQSPQRRRSPQFLQVPPPTFRCGTLPVMKLPSVTKFSPVKRSSSIRRPSSIVVTNEVEGKRVLEVSLDDVQEDQNSVQMERKVAASEPQKNRGALVIAVIPRWLALFYDRGNLGALFEKQVYAAMQGDTEARAAAYKLIQSGELKKFLIEVYGKKLGEKKLTSCAFYFVEHVGGLIPKGSVCPVCKEDIGVGGYIAKPCLHIFCTACVEKWKKESKKKSCPLCRGTMHSPERGSKS